MSSVLWHDRIVIDPEIHHGDPCIRGTRVPVAIIVGCLSSGDSVEDVIEAYPQITPEDLGAALLFATEQNSRRILATRDYRYSLAFRLVGDDLPVTEIESMLGIKPDYFARKGEHLRRNPKYAVHKSDIWTANFTTDDSIPFEQQISDLLDKLEEKRAELTSLLSTQGRKGDLFLGFFSETGQGGTSFSPGLLRRVSSLGLWIEYCAYATSFRDENLGE